jgi:hypothetical protein
MEDSVKLTDTQRRLLAAASQRDDRALERPSILTGDAATKVVARLVTEGLIEEIQSRGSLPVWRRDGDNAHTLRITKRGLQAIRDDEAAATDELLLEITSFREFLRLRRVSADEADLLEAALAEDRAASVVAEGLRRNAITKMELRDQAVLDQYQDEIFRLSLDTRLVILGPPGTGKTTTLIKRLGLKLDYEYLTDDEKELITSTAAGSARHAQSWIMFTPTDLLRQYVKEAFARENIPASDERISTWDDLRRDVARHRFGILRSGTGSGIFVMKDDVPSMQATTLARQQEWFADFDRWQSEYFWNDLRANAQALSAHKDSGIARLGVQLLETLPPALSGTGAASFPGLAAMADEVQALISRLRMASDGTIRTAIGHELKRDRAFHDRLAEFVATLSDTDDGEDEDGEEDDRRPIRVGKDAAVDALARAIRGKARAKVMGRALNRETRNGRIIEWLGERCLPDGELLPIGESIQGRQRPAVL